MKFTEVKLSTLLGDPSWDVSQLALPERLVVRSPGGREIGFARVDREAGDPVLEVEITDELVLQTLAEDPTSRSLALSATVSQADPPVAVTGFPIDDAELAKA